ncbi:hypothetical protein ACFORL_08255 [Legionella dresdenensis]|uniref:Uncharacterized protein n=1 Tax=Legionella dresdenensis TaxID=450200 RepID=A0ABV8CFE9_9GAMM
MKYTDLIAPEYTLPPENEFHKKYFITRPSADISYFIHFSSLRLQRSSQRKISRNWKARLSIHPEDMDKAWEIILPFLYKEDIHFKVANLNAIEKFKNGRQERLNRLVEEYNQFLQNADSQDIRLLKNTFQRRYQQLGTSTSSKWRLISFVQNYLIKLMSFFYQYTLNRESLFAHTKNIYERLIDLGKQKVTNSLRFYEGMQFTLYMLPGVEKECQNTLEEIEDNLLRAKIRPGGIFPTDRQIGVYSSIRHPGKWSYHNATDANLETYNPDNINDPFSFLKTLPPTEIMQGNKIQTILENKADAQLIISLLQTQQFIAPSQFKALAVFKEEVVKHIKTLPVEIKKQVRADCLDKSSNLGKFFRVQRGMFSPKSGHGTLKHLEDIRINP